MTASELPELIANRTELQRQCGSNAGFNAWTLIASVTAMSIAHEKHSSHAELHTREPLRLAFAIVALLLGFVASFH